MLQPSVPAWFEIPARDMERAVRFWETLLDARLLREEMGPMRMAVFPHADKQPSGAVVHAPGYEPVAQGTVVYLNVQDVRPLLARVGEVGGDVVLPLQQLPDEAGVFAQIRDSEGNRVGLFSRT
jgi:predicted enzyme related to lactoylglutathione lyase